MMKSTQTKLPRLTFRPLTPDRWPDLELLFGTRGACGGCWCMSPRLRRADFSHSQGAANKRAFKKVVKSGPPPGILAYAGKTPVGWCALAPREVYIRLEKSRVLQPVDEQPVWSVVCFFVAKPYRRQGVSVQLLSAAVAFAKRHKAKIVEGYPFDYKSKQTPDTFVWYGLAGAFREAGFEEVLRRSPSRPIMRMHVTPKPRRSRT